MPVFAQARPTRFEACDSQGVKASRDDTTLYLTIDATVKSPITIPRLAAALRVATFANPQVEGQVTIIPNQETWEIHWKERPAGDLALLWLQFDSAPLLPSELKPIAATGDGSIYLPAHLARTRGEKIRYEPQPHKNTVGYWTGKADSATWAFVVDRPGRFNVAILQGCGKGQGGSTATLAFSKKDEKPVEAMLGFETLETGHFQNFQWHNIGEVELSFTGEAEVMIAPKLINKAALMDVRAVHLIRLPDQK